MLLCFDFAIVRTFFNDFDQQFQSNVWAVFNWLLEAVTLHFFEFGLLFPKKFSSSGLWYIKTHAVCLNQSRRSGCTLANDVPVNWFTWLLPRFVAVTCFNSISDWFIYSHSPFGSEAIKSTPSIKVTLSFPIPPVRKDRAKEKQTY